MNTTKEILYADEGYAIQGAIFEVYRQMGCGFLESVYQECLELELAERGVPFVAQKQLDLHYKSRLLQQKYKPDLICFDKIIIELKATRTLDSEHQSQVLNYLNATKFRLGLLVNFGHFPKVQIERIVL
jgi:GxxExxY protein